MQKMKEAAAEFLAGKRARVDAPRARRRKRV